MFVLNFVAPGSNSFGVLEEKSFQLCSTVKMNVMYTAHDLVEVPQPCRLANSLTLKTEVEDMDGLVKFDRDV